MKIQEAIELLKIDPESILKSLDEKETLKILDHLADKYYNNTPVISDELFDIIKEYFESEYNVKYKVGAPIKSNISTNLTNSTNSTNLTNSTNSSNLSNFPEIKKQNLQAGEIANSLNYSGTSIEYSGYKLSIPSGTIQLSNKINVILGENGTGKTTFINWLGSKLGLVVSIKEQSSDIKKFINKDGTYPTVLELLYHRIKSNYFNSTFQTDVIKQLEIEPLQTRKINELSGGELQRVLIVLCLGTPADIYLLDEPSANLDIEKRLKVIKIIKKFIANYGKTAYIIEHDIMMSVAFAQEYNSTILLVKQDDYLEGIKYCSISSPLDFISGINGFLKLMGITMRISGHNRPRINKFNSLLDKEQKKAEKYYGI